MNDAISLIQNSEANFKINFNRDVRGYSLKVIAKRINDRRNDNLEAVLNYDVVIDDSNFNNGSVFINIPYDLTNIPVGEYVFQIELSSRSFREAFKHKRLTVSSNINKE